MRRVPLAPLLLAVALAAAAGASTAARAQGIPTDTLRGSGIDAQDRFGSATALRGDRLVVGAPVSRLAVGGPSFPAGRAYAFRRDASSGAWAETQVLRPTPPPASGDTDFGAALGLSADGSLLVVGAPFESVPGAAQVGSGYTYRFEASSGQWVPDGKLLTTATTAFVHTGRSVAVAGSADGTAIAAMHGGPDGNSAALYRRAAGGGAWALEAVVHPGTPDCFVDISSGQQLALAAEGERLAAGAALEDTPGGSGAVYIYRNDGPAGGPAAWVLERRFAPTEPGAGQAFGSSVALSPDGRLLLVGADDFANSSIGPGRAYVYRREGSGSSSVWVEEAVIPSPAGPGFVGFGWGAALSEEGGSAVAGVGQGGHLWLYRRAGSGVGATWSLLGVVERLMVGNSVALDGRRGSAGNPFDGEEGENAGVAYVFDLTSVVTAGEAGPEAPSGLGVSVAPNPVGVVASLTLTLPASGAVRVGVYDALGREVAVAFEGVLGAGPHRLPLNVSSLAPGAYVVRVRTEAGAATARLAVVR